LIPLIKVTGLRRQFGSLCAVDDLSFQVFPGEVYGLLGPNGAGKTTTLRTLAGLLQVTDGTVVVDGKSPSTEAMEVRHSLGYLTSDTALYERLTPRETLHFFGRLNGMTSSALDSRVQQLTIDLGLTEFLERRCEKLSTGQRQRTAIARALIHDPTVLVLDEPTASLDVLASRFILDCLKLEAEKGKAVLLSTHNLTEAELVCDRIGVLHNGRLLGEGTAAELRDITSASSLSEAFLKLIDGAAAQTENEDQL